MIAYAPVLRRDASKVQAMTAEQQQTWIGQINQRLSLPEPVTVEWLVGLPTAIEQLKAYVTPMLARA